MNPSSEPHLECSKHYLINHFLLNDIHDEDPSMVETYIEKLNKIV